MQQVLASSLLLISLLLPTAYCAATTDHSNLATQEFFERATVSVIKISPDGQKVIYSQQHEKDFTLTLITNKGNSKSILLRYTALFPNTEAYIKKLAWIDNHHIVISLSQSIRPIAELSDTKTKPELFFIDTRNPVMAASDLYSIRTSGTLVSTLPTQDNMFLYAKAGNQSRVYKLDVSKLQKYGAARRKTERPDGGQFNLKQMIAKSSGYSYKWFMQNGQIVAATNVDKYGTVTLLQTKDGGKTWGDRIVISTRAQIKNNNGELAYYPVAFDSTTGTYLAVVRHQNETQALYRIDPNKDENELIYQHPTSDIYFVESNRDGSRLRSVMVKSRGEPQFIYFDDKHEVLISSLRKKGLTGYISLIDSDLSNQRHIVVERDNNNPGRFYYVDESSGNLTLLKRAMPALDKKLKSRFEVGQVRRDELDIEYFLTLPSSASKNAAPLIVIPHGGPIGVMDGRTYDPVTQLFVHKGYAVLQVNYRGSSGYGREFREAGKKQWGSGMLADIKAASDLVTSRPDVDARRVCIAGGSYGGYAALAMPLKYPGIFKCAAAFAAVTDVQLYASRLDANLQQRTWLKDYVGDPAKEYTKLRDISPVYNAENYTIPVFLAHGDADQIVDLEHYSRMLYALTKANKPVDAHLLNGVEHGFKTAAKSSEFYKKMLDFIGDALQQR